MTKTAHEPTQAELKIAEAEIAFMMQMEKHVDRYLPLRAHRLAIVKQITDWS